MDAARSASDGSDVVIAALIDDAVHPQAALLSLLAEQHEAYQGFGTLQAEAIRASALAAFARYGLPQAAMPIVLAELETGQSPPLLAGAATALHGCLAPPAEGLQLLVEAAQRLRRFDTPMAFGYGSPISGTALGYVLSALLIYGAEGRARLAALKAQGGLSMSLQGQIEQTLTSDTSAPPVQARCCADHSAIAEAAPPSLSLGVPAIEMEDQFGEQIDLPRLLADRVAVLGFFYTRCMNPQKCSLTISRLAVVARDLAADVDAPPSFVAGITYDPTYDQAQDLAAYGLARDFPFSAGARLLRTVGPFDPLREAFELGVGYGASTVNQHRLDLLIIDAAGSVILAHRHRLWEPDAVCAAVRRARLNASRR